MNNYHNLGPIILAQPYTMNYLITLYQTVMLQERGDRLHLPRGAGGVRRRRAAHPPHRVQQGPGKVGVLITHFKHDTYILRDKMNCTIIENCFFNEFPELALAAWQKTAGLVHQRNTEKTVSKPRCTIHFVSQYCSPGELISICASRRTSPSFQSSRGGIDMRRPFFKR